MAFDERILRDDSTGLVLDASDAPALDLDALQPALQAMARLERGAHANPDEDRMVGHYWLRHPDLAPSPEIAAEIRAALQQALALDRGAHTDLLWIGIGGSALGPQLVYDALSHAQTPLRVRFLDNTDPQGFQDALQAIDPARTLVVVVSKSGGTVETRNGQLAAQARWQAAGEAFAPHAIAITGPGSRLWDEASDWRARLPLWDWVGGRTSITGPVGTVLMALCGMDAEGFLEGAAACDALTRGPAAQNPAAWLAAAWYAAGEGVGNRNLVILPYKDRYLLLSRYLQQLVMESLGKRLDRQGREVFQGLTVYGNKGSTDQHAFVQQLRDGRQDAFVHFIETADPGPLLPGADGHLAADHLLGFLYGTREALAQAGRPSITLQVPDVSARALGILIALFERAVGLYGELIDVNAYHQPGVEAGKKAATQTTALLQALQRALTEQPTPAEALAQAVGGQSGRCWRLLHHLAATGRATVTTGQHPGADQFSKAH